MISTLMSGYRRRNFASFGQRTVSAAYSVVVMRIVPAGLSRSSLERRKLGLDLFEPRAERVQEALARVRRRHAARGAGQQPDAEPRFERAHGMAQRRLRDAELRRRLGEAALAPDGDEGHEVIEMAALHL